MSKYQTIHQPLLPKTLEPNTENRDFDSNNVENYLLPFSSITIFNFNSSKKYCFKL